MIDHADKSSTPDDPFVAELKRWRETRGASQKALAAEVDYAPSYVSKVEGGKQNPSAEFAKAADETLGAGGALRRAFAARNTNRPAVPTAGVLVADDHRASLVVEHDDAELSYDGRYFTASMRRLLRNESNEPVTRYFIRISVDRFPGNPDRSNQLYREDPLTWEELDLTARCGTEEMAWSVQHDRDACKEVWLRFENQYGRFPLYPGQSTTIEYSYRVADSKWGSWFQRAVRLPTRRVGVTLRLPSELQPVVWGLETTMTAEAFPFRSAVEQHRQGDMDVYTWSTEDPPLHARYRMEWRFRAQEPDHSQRTPEETMTALGLVQNGDAMLSSPARRYDLPAEAEDARRAIAELSSAADRIAEVHNFGKGMGLAAPQIGIDRAAAIVRPPGEETITLLNPTVIESSIEIDEQYEGCLSFFDVRGKVPRPLTIHVEHQDVDGTARITSFDRGVARLVAHEIDHLHGMLYSDRMPDGAELLSVTEYRGGGTPWRYQ